MPPRLCLGGCKTQEVPIAHPDEVSTDYDAGKVTASQGAGRQKRHHQPVAFLEAAVAWYARLGVTVERVMTDNGSCYRSKTFNKACRASRLRHIFTRPYTPRTNGKAERFIQSSLREWAYARAYQNSDQRTGELQHWMHHYNWHRPHAGIKGKVPIA